MGVKRLFVSLAVLALIFAYLAGVYSQRYALSAPRAVCIYLAFVLLLALALAPGFTRKLPPVLARFPFLLIPLWCAPYLIYSSGTGDFRPTALLKLIAIAASTWAVYKLFPVEIPALFTWQDAVTAVLLVGFTLSGRLKGIWNVPANLDFMSRLFMIAVGAGSWTYLRPVPELGYEFRFPVAVLRQAASNFFLFAIIALPASLALHFTIWNPRWHGAASFFLDYLEIFLFVALLEELFFRGFLQNLLSKTLGSWLAGQLIVSCLFGFFHILHAPFPNWRYVALASLAGWFYGSAYRKSGSLLASSLTHAAVDTVWRTWFSAR